MTPAPAEAASNTNTATANIKVNLMEKYYSRTEAARVLGVNEQTVSNYSQKGLFPSFKDKASGRVLFPKDLIDELARERENGANVVYDIEQTQRILEKEYAELSEAAEAYRQEIRGFKNNTAKISPRIETIKSLIKGVEAITGDAYEVRDWKILEMALDGASIEEISDSLKLSRERTRQLLQQVYRKTMRGLPNVVREKILDVQKENDLLRKENDRLKADNAMMHKSIINYPKANESYEKAIAETGNMADLVEANKLTLSMPYREANAYLSVRSLTALRNAGVETVADIIFIGKNRLRKLRNLGRKSLDEIFEFIDRLNLSWDWDVSAYTSGHIKSIYLEE